MVYQVYKQLVTDVVRYCVKLELLGASNSDWIVCDHHS